MADTTRLYFAYGSNTNLDQMAYRCPAAEVVGPVVLDNYALAFRGRADSNGVATIIPQQGEKVYGVLWKITPECERSLNIYEGYPHLYGKETVTVRDENGQKIPVMAYVMTRERSQEPAMPSTYYYQGIREGFRQNGLPLRPLNQAVSLCRNEVARYLGISPRRIPSPVRQKTDQDKQR